MVDTPKPGETKNQEPLENEAPKPATPPAEEKKTDSEVESARKKAEQAEMRANQLANELKAMKEADEARKAKELESKEEFKTLYEQEKAKREEIERERETEAQRKALKKASKTILADYSDEVRATAEDLGMSLSENTDDAVAEFKAKLDKIQARVGNQRVTPNNPRRQSSQQEYSREELRQILNDPVKRDEYYRKKNGVTAMMMESQ